MKLLLSILCFKLAIVFLKAYIQPIREDGPKHHNVKAKTPTMGGIVIILGSLIQLLIKGLVFHPVSIALIGFGLLGLYDDICKVKHQDTYLGIAPKFKFLLQWMLAFCILKMININHQVVFFGFEVSLGIFYWLFAAFIIVATSNAYNLTDGLDGLAASQGLILLFGYGVFAVSKGDHDLVNVIASIWTMLFGFYWVNRHPAKLFMGDVGSLSIGAVLGLLAVTLKVEIAFALASIFLVWETVSVILQVFFFKLGYGRIFKMAPYHHHLELSGWSESQIVIGASLLTILMLYLGTYAV